MASASPAAAVDPHAAVAASSWRCPSCTFDNASASLACDMCQQERGALKESPGAGSVAASAAVAQRAAALAHVNAVRSAAAAASPRASSPPQPKVSPGAGAKQGRVWRQPWLMKQVPRVPPMPRALVAVSAAQAAAGAEEVCLSFPEAFSIWLDERAQDPHNFHHEHMASAWDSILEGHDEAWPPLSPPQRYEGDKRAAPVPVNRLPGGTRTTLTRAYAIIDDMALQREYNLLLAGIDQPESPEAQQPGAGELAAAEGEGMPVVAAVAVTASPHGAAPSDVHAGEPGFDRDELASPGTAAPFSAAASSSNATAEPTALHPLLQPLMQVSAAPRADIMIVQSLLDAQAARIAQLEQQLLTGASASSGASLSSAVPAAAPDTFGVADSSLTQQSVGTSAGVAASHMAATVPFDTHPVAAVESTRAAVTVTPGELPPPCECVALDASDAVASSALNESHLDDGSEWVHADVPADESKEEVEERVGAEGAVIEAPVQSAVAAPHPIETASSASPAPAGVSAAVLLDSLQHISFLGGDDAGVRLCHLEADLRVQERLCSTENGRAAVAAMAADSSWSQRCIAHLMDEGFLYATVDEDGYAATYPLARTDATSTRAMRAVLLSLLEQQAPKCVQLSALVAQVNAAAPGLTPRPAAAHPSLRALPVPSASAGGVRLSGVWGCGCSASASSCSCSHSIVRSRPPPPEHVALEQQVAAALATLVDAGLALSPVARHFCAASKANADST